MMTVSEAAKRRGKGHSCIIAAIYSGKLKATLYGNSYIILESDFQEYLESLRSPGRPKKHSKIADEMVVA
jgi:excisionase family DNA binding protein